MLIFLFELIVVLSALGGFLLAIYYWNFKDNSLEILEKNEIDLTNESGFFVSEKKIRESISLILNPVDVLELKRNLKFRRYGWIALCGGWCFAIFLILIL